MTHDGSAQVGSSLAQLAQRAGVAISFRDWQWCERPVPADSLVSILSLLGHPAEDDEAIARSLELLERRPWEGLLEPVAVISSDSGGFTAAPAVSEDLVGAEFSWLLELENGGRQQGRFIPAHLMECGRRDLDGVTLTRRELRLTAVPMGYHRLRIEGPGGKPSADQILVAAPDRCWQPETARRHWGVAVQLYGLRGRRDWGIGDFGGLGLLADDLGRSGVSMIGVNPLHALHPRKGGNSPYFPSNRLFLNPLYIDVTAVPDFAECEEAKRVAESPGFAARLDGLRRSDLIDYAGVSDAKRKVLELLYAAFREAHLGGASGTPATDRGRDFRRFQAEHGRDLRDYAVFEALSETIGLETPWPRWPEDLRRPDGEGIAAFESAHLERIEFFEYLQWETERQLMAAVDVGKRAGMDLGLYGDLALGTAPEGGEAWAYQDCLVFGARVGAPPDAFNQLGQDWGFPPFNPQALRDRAYRPFAAALQATMRACGAVRIDHVMGLARLYWIPADRPPAEGAYVDYPLDDLLAVVRLESHRNQCIVVGEDLGTVPVGFRDRLAAHGLLSYRVMYFERADDGGFIAPEHYPAQALATVSTHDLPTLAGYWGGTDLDEKVRLGLFASPEAEEAARRGRDNDRARLRDYLAWHTGLPAGGEVSHRDLAEAVLRVLAKTPSRLAVVQVEDLIGVLEQANMPGTTIQHPNWRRRLPRTVPELLADPVFAVLREFAGG